MRRRASSRIQPPYRRTSSARPRAPDQPALDRSSASGWTGGRPENRGGSSTRAFVMRTATGLRSLARTSSPSLWPSSGMEPPPQNGSSKGGGPSGHEAAISWRTALRTFGSDVASHRTSSSMSVKRRWRSTSCVASVGNRSGCADGSSTSEANSTARQAASGFLDHQRCRLDGWPWRIDFSRAASRLIATKGSETSMSLRLGILDSEPCLGGRRSIQSHGHTRDCGSRRGLRSASHGGR